MGFDLAFLSIAQIPRETGCWVFLGPLIARKKSFIRTTGL